MTRDQAEKIARAVMDEIEQSRLISKDRLTDCIFNQYHKSTADQYRATYVSASYEGMRRAAVELGMDPKLICSPEELCSMRDRASRPTEYVQTTSRKPTAVPPFTGYYIDPEWFRDQFRKHSASADLDKQVAEVARTIDMQLDD